LAAGLVTLVGFSRIALGAHYLSDVLAAIFGIIWLTVCGIVGKPMRQRPLQVSLAAADSPSAGEAPLPVPVEQPRDRGEFVKHLDQSSPGVF
jgi:hypothetical protein